MASQRAARALNGTDSLGQRAAGISWGIAKQRDALAKLDMAEPRHRQALTRTAEARLGWTLTREGTVARRTAVASHHRATALQSMAKAKHSAALAWSARRCEAGPRLRSARSAGASPSLERRRLSEDGVATARESEAIKRGSDAGPRYAPIRSAAATQSTAVATHSFALAATA